MSPHPPARIQGPARRGRRHGGPSAPLALFALLLSVFWVGCEGNRFAGGEGFREREFGAGFERSLPGRLVQWKGDEEGARLGAMRVSRRGLRVMDGGMTRLGRVRLDGEGGYRVDRRDGARICRITVANAEALLWCDEERWLSWRPHEAELRSGERVVARVVGGEDGLRLLWTNRPTGPDGPARAGVVEGAGSVWLVCPGLHGVERTTLEPWRRSVESALVLCAAWEWALALEGAERLLLAGAAAWMIDLPGVDSPP